MGWGGAYFDFARARSIYCVFGLEAMAFDVGVVENGEVSAGPSLSILGRNGGVSFGKVEGAVGFGGLGVFVLLCELLLCCVFM